MEGENAYFCEQVGRPVTALKRTCIKELPQTLVIHLKRFEYDHHSMQRWASFTQHGGLDAHSDEVLTVSLKTICLAEDNPSPFSSIGSSCVSVSSSPPLWTCTASPLTGSRPWRAAARRN